MRIEYLYRYPVKGLTAEALEAAEVEDGRLHSLGPRLRPRPGRRRLRSRSPGWLPKTNFMCLMRNARIAALRSSFEPRSGMLAIRAPDGASIAENALTESGRERIGAFLTGFMGEEARGTPRFYYVPGHSFCDQSSKVVSLINLASLRDFEARIGARRQRRRFRANVWFGGAAPWAELDWVGGKSSSAAPPCGC